MKGAGKRKDSVSMNARIGPEMFRLLEEYCEITGQPKTVAVERAIRQFCAAPPPAEAGGHADER